VEIRPSFHNFDYRDIILKSKQLTVILNDGRSWVPAHRELLRDRLAIQGRETRFCFIHPASPYLPLLIQKSGKSEVRQLEEMLGSFDILTEIAPKLADCEIRAHSRPTPYCLYLTEEIAIVTPYIYFEAGSLPLLSFVSDTELYSVYREDARKLLKEAVLPGKQAYMKALQEAKAKESGIRS